MLKSTITAMLNDNQLPPSTKNLIVTAPQTSRIYLLHKIYKARNPDRPIASVCYCPTENIASYEVLDHIMCPLVRNLDTYVKDTNHVLKIFNYFRFQSTMNGGPFLFTVDIQSIYCHPEQQLRSSLNLLSRQASCFRPTHQYTHPSCRTCAEPTCLHFLR